ncbi:unnamed protein product, partial [Polarella glacialis]
MASLPDKLHGVSDQLRSWWLRSDPAELDRATIASGRSKVLAHVSKLLGAGLVLDLGCGPGLLAKQAGRRDVVGVDMSPAMLCAA